MSTSDSLPYTEDGEKGVLCSLILSPKETGNLCIQRLSAKHFYNPAHRIIFETLFQWRGDGAVQFPWLKEEIKKRGLLEEVGGLESLSALFDFVPTGTNAGYYVDDVLEVWARRASILEYRRREAAAFDRSTPASSFDPDGIFAPSQSLFGFPPLESADVLLAEKIKEPPELVRGLLHQGSKMGIGGGSKSFKTWLLSDLGVSLAAEELWLGCETLAGKVLYVNLEIQRAFYKKRIEAIAAAKKLPTNGGWRRNLDVWNLRGYCVDAESLCKGLRRAAEGYLAIIVDPIYKIVGNREENSNEQIASLLNLLEKVARETGAAIIYGNHFSKGNQAAKESIDRISGAGVFARDPDSIVTLTKHETDNAYAVESALRNFPPLEPFVVRWEYPLFVRDETLDPKRLKKQGRPVKWTVDQLVECLGEKDLKTSDFQKLVSDETGMPRSTFFLLLPQAASQGLLHKCATDDKWEVVRK
jgi:hypothetical protein